MRDSLDVLFHGRNVNDLGEIVFLVANEGVHPIREVVRPLVVTVPEGTELLDASVLYVHPEGRSVVAIHQDRSVECRFELLNPGDYFILKFLLDGPAHARDIEFSITAVGLPPRLQVSPRAYSTAEPSRRADVGLGLVGLIFLAVAASVITALTLVKISRPELLPFVGFDLSVASVAMTSGALLAALFAVVTAIIGSMMAAAAFFGGSFPPKRTFIVPPHLRQYTSPQSRHFDGLVDPDL